MLKWKFDLNAKEGRLYFEKNANPRGTS